MCKWFYPMNKKNKVQKLHSHLEAVYAIKSNYTAFYPSCYHYKTITKLQQTEVRTSRSVNCSSNFSITFDT